METCVNTHRIKNTIYSVGLSGKPSLREQVLFTHDHDPDMESALQQLDDFLNDPDFVSRPAVKRFAGYVRRKNPETDIALSIINEGYLTALKRLSIPSGKSVLERAKEYSLEKDITIPEAMLFGSRGCAYFEFANHQINEKIHGMHRPGRQIHPLWTDQTKKVWADAYNSCNIPVKKKEFDAPFQIPSDLKYLPEGISSKIENLWRQDLSLMNYSGVNRLSGELPYQIIEDMVDVIARGDNSVLSVKDRLYYCHIVEDANKKGIDPFYAVYHQFDEKKLKSLWFQARTVLYRHSLRLWEKKNEAKLSEGKRLPPEGVTFKPKPKTKRVKKKIPGTIYLNNKRYYWIVKGKTKPVPLIDPATKPKYPGTIFMNGTRYYWMIPRWLKRQRLVAKGEKFSTDDKETAEKIIIQKWKRLQKDDPQLAAKIKKHTYLRGLATKDRKIAEKIALKKWNYIKKNDQLLAKEILTDRRLKACDRWYAQIKTDGKVRFIGSFKTKKQAQAAYRKEFIKAHGYPPGYNVQYIPKIDKVWPCWNDQKLRLALIKETATMPVIGQTVDNKSLEPLIGKMQKVDWLVKNCILEFDGSCPLASKAIAIQSRGQRWYSEYKKCGSSIVIKGSASIDKSTGRIRLTIYKPGFADPDILKEEIYHTVFEIIEHKNKRMFSKINRWHKDSLISGSDPTYGTHEAFADSMVNAEKGSNANALPGNVIDYAQKIFSPDTRIKEAVFENITAGT